jgi:hypothetical protein
LPGAAGLSISMHRFAHHKTLIDAVHSLPRQPEGF